MTMVGAFICRQFILRANNMRAEVQLKDSMIIEESGKSGAM